MTKPRRCKPLLAVAVILQFAGQARADITSFQLQELQMQAQLQTVKTIAVMLGIAEGCAQVHPALRTDVDQRYGAIGMDEELKGQMRTVIAACMDKSKAPGLEQCQQLVQRVNPPLGDDGLGAFFEAARPMRALAMVEPCE